MEKRNLRLDSTIVNRLNNGAELLDLKIFSKRRGDKKCYYNIVINEDTLLRIEQKGGEKAIRSVRAWTQSANKLISADSRKQLRRMLELDGQIKDKIRHSTTRAGASADGFTDFYSTLVRRWEDIRKLEQKLGIKLLRKDSIGYCDRCHVLREASGLAGQSSPPCQICSKPITKSKVYFSLPEVIAQYINGFWFEDYVARKLEHLGWKTFVGVYVFGRSGVKHEIDIVAIKQGRTVIIECKSGNSGLSDLSMFAAKFSEIRTTSAIFISIPQVNKNLHKLSTVVGGLQVWDKIDTERRLLKMLKKM